MTETHKPPSLNPQELAMLCAAEMRSAIEKLEIDKWLRYGLQIYSIHMKVSSNLPQLEGPSQFQPPFIAKLLEVKYIFGKGAWSVETSFGEGKEVSSFQTP